MANGKSTFVFGPNGWVNKFQKGKREGETYVGSAELEEDILLPKGTRIWDVKNTPKDGKKAGDKFPTRSFWFVLPEGYSEEDTVPSGGGGGGKPDYNDDDDVPF